MGTHIWTAENAPGPVEICILELARINAICNICDVVVIYRKRAILTLVTPSNVTPAQVLVEEPSAGPCVRPRA